MNLKKDINYILEKQEEERIKRNEIELVKILYIFLFIILKKKIGLA